jgi:hypothetical protein
VEGYCSRLEQVQYRISELTDKIDIKEKNRRTLKNHRRCERNMQEIQQFHQKIKTETHGD